MYLHIGQEFLIDESKIIGIFDLDNSTQSHVTRKYLKKAEEKNCIVNTCEDIPKTFIVSESKGKSTIYLSQLNSATLLKRSDSGFIE